VSNHVPLSTIKIVHSSQNNNTDIKYIYYPPVACSVLKIEENLEHTLTITIWKRYHWSGSLKMEGYSLDKKK
jgi:hypothetical protein